LRQQAAEFAAAGAEVVVVTFWAPERAAELRRAYDLPFPVLVDGERAVYRRYGLGSGHPRDFLSARALAAYGRALRRGGWRRLHRPVEDPRQLGGDFVVAADGRLSLVHVTRHPGDRPSVAELLAACRAGAAR
jgi:hypothetical protein